MASPIPMVPETEDATEAGRSPDGSGSHATHGAGQAVSAVPVSIPSAVYVTIGFKCADHAAFSEFWKDARERYRFAEDGAGAAAQAFAVSMGNMFEEQDVIDAILASDLAGDEIAEAIGAVPCHQDLRGLCAEWGVTHPYEAAQASCQQQKGGAE